MLTNSAGNDTPWINAKATRQATNAANSRKLSGRRRFVDPTTCERDYKADEIEFMAAMQEYKRTSGRTFPTWSEVLNVVKDMGYERAGGVGSRPATA